MAGVPIALTRYMEGLKTHDVGLIASTFADDIKFVTPVKTMTKAEIVAFLSALYRGFPDWHYAHRPVETRADGSFAVWWRQGGRHTGPLEFPGFPAVAPTQREVRIPEHYFFYRVTSDKLSEIRPDPVPGGAPRGIFEQIGVTLPPL